MAPYSYSDCSASSKAHTCRTTLICTLGPAISDVSKLEDLLNAGADVIRLNFSHGNNEQKKEYISMIRAAEEKVGKPVSILQDLQGPKLRVGDLRENAPIFLKDDSSLVITTQPCIGTEECISVNYSHLPADVASGDPILLADGSIILRVTHVEDDNVHCRVVHGDYLYPHKGVNLPGVNLSIPAMTEKDEEDLAFGLKNEIDWIALSFVRHAEDIISLRRKIKELWDPNEHPEHTHPPRIVAKIEKPEAVQNLGAIADVADALMVARGDLGVEISPERVPVVQKNIIAAGRQRGIPVITATQMLESMVHSPVPTRAEASDVANAIFDKTDAIMLSAETAVGDYPIHAVNFLTKVARESEEHAFSTDIPPHNMSGSTDAIAVAACDAAHRMDAAVIAVYTHTGRSAIRIAACRPHIHILAFCSSISVCRQLMLYWNIRTEAVPVCATHEELIALADKRVAAYNKDESHDYYVLVSGSQALPGKTDSLQVRPL